jgi:sarcosine oxidase, subunit gamma
MAEAKRIGPLDGRRLAFGQVALEPAPPAVRFVLRGTGKSRGKIGDAAGVALPDRPKTSTSANGVTILWLGPDEWLAIADTSADMAVRIAALDDGECSVVDVSHRNCAIIVSGSGAEDVIVAGCPQDLSLSAFAVGACSRTVLGKSEIVLYRVAADRFRIECWRSFSDYVWRFLADAAKCA